MRFVLLDSMMIALLNKTKIIKIGHGIAEFSLAKVDLHTTSVLPPSVYKSIRQCQIVHARSQEWLDRIAWNFVTISLDDSRFETNSQELKFIVDNH